MKTALALLALALAAAPSRAGEPGSSGASFLKLGAGPRATSMGDAQTAVADDSYATYWNPAGLAQLKDPELSFMHNQYFEGVGQQFISYAHPFVGGNALAASITRLSVSAFDAYDNSGAKTGSVSSDDLAVAFSGAHGAPLPGKKAPMVSLGGTIKAVRERLGNTSASTFAVDLGAWSGGWEGWAGDWAKGLQLGVALRHLGPGMRFVSESTRLPSTVALGAARHGKLWGDPLLLAAEMSKSNDGAGVFSVGAEYWLYRMLAVRAGYRTGVDEGMSVRFGVGMKVRAVELDYAFAGYGDLGMTHRMGFTIRFGSPRSMDRKGAPEFVKSAREYMRQDRYYEALLELEQALDDDPGNEEAIELLRQSKTKLQEREKKDGR